MKTGKIKLLIVCTLAFTAFYSPECIYTQVDGVSAHRSDEIQDKADLSHYLDWLGDRIVAAPRMTSALPPPSTICDGDGYFYCKSETIGKVRRSWLAFSFSRGNRTPKAYIALLLQLSDSWYRLRYTAIRNNSLFPLLGSIYCFDEPLKHSAFRIADKDIPKGITLQRRSIIFPICDDTEYLESDLGSDYDWKAIFILDYGKSQEPSDGIWVIVSNKYISKEELKNFQEHPLPGVEVNKYKIGDLMTFTKVSHKIINIVLPDKKDIRTVNRKNADGTTTKLKCRLVGWVELDPTPIPIDKGETNTDE